MNFNFRSIIRAGFQLFGGTVCVGAFLVIASRAPAQNMFVSGYDNGNVFEYYPSGEFSTFAYGLSPGGLAFDKAGNLFEADPGSGNVYKFTPRGVRTTFANGLNYPQGLAFNSRGVLFVAESYFSDNIYEYAPSGDRRTFTSGLSSPANSPSLMAFDEAGNLFVADFNSGDIYKYTSDEARSIFASGYPGQPH